LLPEAIHFLWSQCTRAYKWSNPQ